jgi:type IVB pilus formation R64 PilN family outer membrane protein
MINKSVITTLVTASFLQGCAVSNSDVVKKVNEVEQSTQLNNERLAKQRSLEPSLVKVRGNFIGGNPIELGYKAKLPNTFRDVTLRFPDALGIRQMAERITDTTRVPVDISQDVFINVTSASNPSSGANQNTSVQPSSNTNAGNVPIQMDFRGNLADFLDIVCARLGLGWTYVGGTINISKYVTKSFQLAASPGSVAYGTKVAKGSSASTGSTGGTNSASSGSFSGTSETSVDVKALSPLDSLLTSIRGMLTPTIGKATVNEATGTIVVTDSRMVVDQVGKLIEHENNMLTRQMALQIEMITLQVNDSTQFSVDANVIYNTLSGKSSSSFNSGSSLTSADAGSYSYNVMTGRGAGSTINVKALNGIGRVVSNVTTTLITTNRVPVPLANFATKGYLASTTPGTGGGTAGGTGVPGLTPGSVTTGLFLSALPTILDNNSMLMRLSIDSSNLLSIDSTGTGTGPTFQQIQYPNITGYKSDHNVTMRSGDSLVLVGLNSDQTNGANQIGILSGGLNNKRAQTIQVVVVTPRIQSGI